MYKDYFGFIEEPFSIVPSSKYLFLSVRHREALMHLQAGLGGGGGFAMLTGEVGTGKTTVSKAMLANLEANWVAGLILNPTFSELELLEAVCDEFSLEYRQPTTLKQLSGILYQYLLNNHQQGKQTLLFIDEAQHLTPQVLEQLRLLTNLETDNHKLLKVLLIGQPELQHKLQTVELRQLAQRITGRYHLLPLVEKEIADYIQFRLRVSGVDRTLFSSKAIRIIAKQTQGIPRLINLVCDKALHYAMLSQVNEVDGKIVRQASHDILSFQAPAQQSQTKVVTSSLFRPVVIALFLVSIGVGFMAMSAWQQLHRVDDEHSVAKKLLNENKARAQVLQAENKQLNTLIEQSRFSVTAMQSLYALWGYQASTVDANCRSGVKPPFHCYRGSATLEQVVAFNRPVVLTLYQQGVPFFALFSHIEQEQVELIFNHQRVELPLEWLREHWQGEFKTLWYSKITDTLKLNYQGEQVQELDKLLAKVLNVKPLLTSLFNQELKNRVIMFQEWQGLSADGVVGKRTLRQLDRLATTQAPTLLGQAQEVM